MRSYPAGWPFWRLLARRRVAIRIRLMVIYDQEARVYVALDSNLRGLVAEAETLDELRRNVDAAAQDLLESYLLRATCTNHRLPRQSPR